MSKGLLHGTLTLMPFHIYIQSVRHCCVCEGDESRGEISVKYTVFVRINWCYFTFQMFFCCCKLAFEIDVFYIDLGMCA